MKVVHPAGRSKGKEFGLNKSLILISSHIDIDTANLDMRASIVFHLLVAANGGKITETSGGCCGVGVVEDDDLGFVDGDGDEGDVGESTAPHWEFAVLADEFGFFGVFLGEVGLEVDFVLQVGREIFSFR